VSGKVVFSKSLGARNLILCLRHFLRYGARRCPDDGPIRGAVSVDRDHGFAAGDLDGCLASNPKHRRAVSLYMAW
jgi:hypothetical protein